MHIIYVYIYTSYMCHAYKGMFIRIFYVMTYFWTSRLTF